MGYLTPPPGDAPVIVMKDVGGDVRQYAAATAFYIRTGREVRLHECRSACTIALAVPNVCVYPESVLRFHKAYNPITRATNEAVSQAMLAAYPPTVRDRLGVLTRQYKSLTGSELIRLGVRDCNTPASPKILIARATPRPGDGNGLSDAFGGFMAGFAGVDIPAYRGYAAPVAVQRVKVQVAEASPSAGAAPRSDAPDPVVGAAAAIAPPPPPRPAAAERQASAPAPGAEAAGVHTASVETAPPADPPLPPFRPLAPAAPAAARPVSHWGAPIVGAAPTLASAHFAPAPFPYRLIRRS
jgi:hypothetical protein